MSFLKLGAPYDANDGHSAVLQPQIYPLPNCHKKNNKITCDEGWSLSFSGSSWRIDRYEYCENGRQLVLGGEGATKQFDIVIDSELFWEKPHRSALDDQTRSRVLRNITAALQSAGYDVGFFFLKRPKNA